MSDPTADFFERLGRRRAEMLSRRVRMTLRFDLEGGGGIDHWFAAFDEGTVRVAHEERQADFTVRANKGLFDRIVTGEVDLGAALFRNQIAVEGNLSGLALLRKLLPGPPGAHDPRVFARERAGRR